MATSGSEESLAWRNKHAWDALYKSTEKDIWGREPVGFLTDFLDELRERLVGLPFARLLDAATGEGRNLGALLTLGGSLSCCDASATALRKIPLALRGQLEIVRCELERMPFGDSSFDFILMSDVVETLPNPDEVFEEVGRVLKPGGWLMCNIPGHNDPVAGHEMLALRPGCGALYRDRYYFRFYDEENAVAMLARHGLSVEIRKTCRWGESAHPNFRPVPHEHESNVYLARKGVATPVKRG